MPGSRTLGELPSTAASCELVRQLYSLGAVRVTAVEIDIYDSGEENTGKLIVNLPRDKIARSELFAWCGEWAHELGFDPEEDVGQDHLLVMLD